MASTATWRTRLDPQEVEQVLALVTAATDADGTAPLSEHVLLHLAHGGDRRAANLLLTGPGGALAGYAHLDTTDPVAGASGELVVHPDLRRQGLGRELVEQLRQHSPDGRLRLWAHGQHPAAETLARQAGFTRTRLLWQMRRSLLAPVPAPAWPEGVSVRTFVVGRDEPAWLACNAAAFAGHPEQGGWTGDDLRMREAEPWFDPAGFFLAERADELVGFHWTKVHGARRHATAAEARHEHPAIGEVYVVGVHPAAQGTGLGRALTVHGLRHLRGQGLTQVLLYVDDDNPAALALYERLGFTRWDSDVTYTAG